MTLSSKTYLHAAKIGASRELLEMPTSAFLQKVEVLSTKNLVEMQEMVPALKARLVSLQILGKRQIPIGFCFSIQVPERLVAKVYMDRIARVAMLFKSDFIDFESEDWDEMNKAVFTFFDKKSWDIEDSVHDCPSFKCFYYNCIKEMRHMVRLFATKIEPDHHELIGTIAEYLLSKLQNPDYVRHIAEDTTVVDRTQFIRALYNTLNEGSSSKQAEARMHLNMLELRINMIR